jgi:uncharacterized repeat protein (TIGR01451 family)
MNPRWISLLGLAAFASGCATPNLERIATVQSRAEALYAYGGVATFPVSSDLVEVSVYAPVHHQREYQPIPIEREKTKPIVNRQPTKSAVAEQSTKAAVSQPPAKSAVSEPTAKTVTDEEESAKPVIEEQPTKPAVSEPTKPVIVEEPAKAATGEESTKPVTSEPPDKPVVSQPAKSVDAATPEQPAPTKPQESVAQTTEVRLESAEPAPVQKETVVVEQPVMPVDKPQAADVRQQSLAPDTRVSEKQPTFHKKVSKDRVNVAEKFAFTLEFRNTTPLDLASVQLTDPIDARLKLFPDEVTVSPNYEHHVSVGNGQVIVRFTQEIKRGKKVRVTVPVMFPVTSAASAQ